MIVKENLNNDYMFNNWNSINKVFTIKENHLKFNNQNLDNDDYESYDKIRLFYRWLIVALVFLTIISIIIQVIIVMSHIKQNPCQLFETTALSDHLNDFQFSCLYCVVGILLCIGGYALTCMIYLISVCFYTAQEPIYNTRLLHKLIVFVMVTILLFIMLPIRDDQEGRYSVEDNHVYVYDHIIPVPAHKLVIDGLINVNYMSFYITFLVSSILFIILNYFYITRRNNFVKDMYLKYNISSVETEDIPENPESSLLAIQIDDTNNDIDELLIDNDNEELRIDNDDLLDSENE